MVENFAAWILSRRALVLIISLILVALAAAGGRFLQFTTDYRVFFSTENPQLQAFERLQNIYTKNDNVLFVLAPKDGNVFTRETLETVTRLTEAAWQIPYSIRVDSITNFQHTRAEADDLVVGDLVVDPLTLSDADLEQIEGIALQEPLLVNRLISPRAHVTGVNVTIQLKGEHPEREVPKTVAFARTLADEVRAENPELDVHLTGIVMMNHLFSEASVQDMRTLVPLMFGVVILTLTLLLRSLAATLVTVLVIIFSILGAMGLAGWFGIRLTPPSATAPTIILTLAVADGVHVLLTYLQGLRRGTGRKAAMAESLRVNFQPVFLTSLTTAIGFLSMNFSDAPPFRDLGNIVAMGVAIAFVLSVTFLPALATLLPTRIRVRAARRVHPMERFAEFVVHQRQPLLWGMSMVVVFMILMIPRNELNDEFVKYFDERIEFRRDTDFTTANLTGIYTIDYSLGSGENGGISNPDFQRHVEAFANWFREQPEVIHVNSFTDVMKRLNKNMHGDAPAWYRTPDARDLAAQYLLLYEMSLPFGLDLNNQINVAKSATRLSVSLQSLSSNQLLNLEKRAAGWLKENAPVPMQVEGSSPAVMFSHIGKRNIRSMLSGTTLALILISLILIVALRSVRIGFTSMIPNLVPAGVAFGFWGLTVGQIGLSLSVVASMSLGIVVDDTVHFLSKYLRARREKGLGPPDAVRYAFSTVGTALWVTSLVLMAGFLILSLSAFEINAGMGLLTAVTIGIALTVDFLFLPPLLMKIEEKQHAKDAVADMLHAPAADPPGGNT